MYCMTPVYFPFTHISSKGLDQLLVLFPSLNILQPTGRPAGTALAEAARHGRVNLHFPPQGTGRTVENLIGEYRQWAQTRLKTDLASFAGLQQATLSSHDESTRHITSSIRQAAAGRAQTPSKDPFLAQLLFLGMAQEFDRQEETTGRRLQACRLAERQMLHRLTGNRDPLAEANAAPDDHTASSVFMLSRRIEAWSAAYLHHTFAAPLFITDTPAVIDHLAEQHPGLLEKGTLPQPGLQKLKNGRPAPADDLFRQIRSLVTDTSKPALQAGSVKPNGLRLTLYVDVDRPPATFWAAFCSTRPMAPATDEMEKDPATVIVLIED